LAVLGLARTLLRWRRADPIDRFMALYGLIYYGLIEASPLNSGVRYALPLALPAAYLGGVGVEGLTSWLAGRVIAWPSEKTVLGAAAALALALVPTAVTGARLVAELKDDTRLIAESVLAGKESQVLTELYGTSFGTRIDTLARVNPQRLPAEIRYLVASSLMYDRFADGVGTGAPSSAKAERIWSHYQALFRLPSCEIRPRVMSFSFSNPTIRIIDLQAARAVGWVSPTGGTSLAAACAETAR
jgi:hypothetical protein